MENALRNAVVQSLAEVARVVNPDAKTLNALFRSLALLDKSSHHVKLNPSLQVTSLPIIFQRVLGSTLMGVNWAPWSKPLFDSKGEDMLIKA